MEHPNVNQKCRATDKISIAIENMIVEKKYVLNVWREQNEPHRSLKHRNNGSNLLPFMESYNKKQKSREQGMQMSCYYPT